MKVSILILVLFSMNQMAICHNLPDRDADLISPKRPTPPTADPMADEACEPSLEQFEKLDRSEAGQEDPGERNLVRSTRGRK